MVAGAISTFRGRERASRWLMAALNDGHVLGGLNGAQAEERKYKSKRIMVACEQPQRMNNLHRLARSSDRKAFSSYFNGLMRDRSCTPIFPGNMVYVEQMDVLDKGIRGGLESALS